MAELVADAELPLPVAPDEALMVGHGLTAEQTSWAFVRQRAARLDEPNDLFDPELAAWMDDGMFSREVLGGLPPTDLMLEALEAGRSAVGRGGHGPHDRRLAAPVNTTRTRPGRGLQDHTRN